MIIELVGGLTSRLDVLASCVNSIHYPEKIKLVWKPDLGVNASFDHLFENDIKFYDLDKMWFNVRTYKGEHLDPRLKQTENEWWVADYPIAFEDTVKYGQFDAHAKKHPFNKFLKNLEIQKHLKGLLEKNYDKFPKEHNTYGINIRRGHGLNYHPNSNICSPIELFIIKIKEILLQEYNPKFVISTDSYYDLEKLCMHYYNHLIFVEEYMDYPLDDGYTLNGMKRSIVDWFLLHKVKKIFCTKEAGFAIRVGRIHNIDVEELISDHQMILNYHIQALSRKGEKRF